MKKIISLFKRNYGGDRLVRNEVTEGAEWVVAGEGVATKKFDGTCCMFKNNIFYKRFDAKQGKKPPEGFIPAQEPDPVTGHWPGWIKVSKTDPADIWHRRALVRIAEQFHLRDGTYELCGPKINGNPEKFTSDTLIPHGRISFPDAPRDFEGLKKWLSTKNIEGIVWHHPDGRMVKIKKKDFGLPRATTPERKRNE